MCSFFCLRVALRSLTIENDIVVFNQTKVGCENKGLWNTGWHSKDSEGSSQAKAAWQMQSQGDSKGQRQSQVDPSTLGN